MSHLWKRAASFPGGISHGVSRLGKSEAGISLDEETVASAQAGIWTAFEHLQMDGFSFVGTQRFEPFLGDIQELKRVEERLRSMQLRDQVAV